MRYVITMLFHNVFTTYLRKNHTIVGRKHGNEGGEREQNNDRNKYAATSGGEGGEKQIKINLRRAGDRQTAPECGPRLVATVALLACAQWRRDAVVPPPRACRIGLLHAIHRLSESRPLRPRT